MEDRFLRFQKFIDDKYLEEAAGKVSFKKEKKFWQKTSFISAVSAVAACLVIAVLAPDIFIRPNDKKSASSKSFLMDYDNGTAELEIADEATGAFSEDMMAESKFYTSSSVRDQSDTEAESGRYQLGMYALSVDITLKDAIDRGFSLTEPDGIESVYYSLSYGPDRGLEMVSDILDVNFVYNEESYTLIGAKVPEEMCLFAGIVDDADAVYAYDPVSGIEYTLYSLTGDGKRELKKSLLKEFTGLEAHK